MSPTTLAITTPRHRGGLMMCSKTQLERWRLLLDTQQSPCQPPQYEDEPEEAGVEADKTAAFRNRSLRYLIPSIIRN